MKRIYPEPAAGVPTRLGALLVAVMLTACADQSDSPRIPEGVHDGPALKEVFARSFFVGAALSAEHVTGRAPVETEIVRRHFNSVTAENAMKWERLHPEPGRYDFDIADRIVEFAETNGMVVIGHTLVWHSQTPRWVFEDDSGNTVGRDTLLARMKDHISTVVGRYRGRVAGWDVVNEALNEDGTLRDSPWRQIIGDDYIAMAFQYAHKADPAAELYYNDYSLPNEAKRDGAVTLIRSLLEKSVPITGIGLQGHYQLDWPSAHQLDHAIKAFAALGIDVMITELDINVLPQITSGAEITDTAAWRAEFDPHADELPQEVALDQAERYEELFRLFVEHEEAITRVTFWGVSDAGSWKNNWPVPGRTNYPLLFDRAGRPKPAFDAAVKAASP